MHALLSRGDPSEKTILLGPLDTFPADVDELTITEAPPSVVHLDSGAPVRVIGTQVVPERTPRLPEEERFLMKPSALLRLRRSARRAIGVALSAVRRPAFLASVGRALGARIASLGPAVKQDLTRVRAVGAAVAASARSLNPAQRRLTAGAFAAGALVASVLALAF